MNIDGARPRAIVIGAGISAATAADTLRTLFGRELELTVFERDSRVGGRAWRREFSGLDVETGASLIHSANRILLDSATALGLHPRPARTETVSAGIWDGSRMVVRLGGGRRAAFTLLARYRLPLVRAGRQVKRFVGCLDSMYPRLAAGQAWESAEDFWRTAGCWEATQVRADATFPSGRFRSEFVDAVSRSNYAQESTELNTLADLVSLAGAGLGGGRLLSIAEGNERIPAGLLTRSGARLHLANAVRRIERADGGWHVVTDDGTSHDADFVVVAAPLETAAIELVGAALPPARRFVTLHVTFVTGRLRAGRFGSGPQVTSLLTAAQAGDPLAMGRMGDVNGGGLYKLFSAQVLNDAALGRLFEIEDVTRMTWASYPRLAPVRNAPGFSLAPGLYYTGAMEYAVSTLETQAIAGVAVANLAAQRHGADVPI